MNNRAIRLTRIHALNWYGYRDSVPVDGNLLLAGVTGSGKSILMDLIQLVLVGDQRLIRFNQSATGDRSDRTLKGYCLGDTKQEIAGVTQYMRDSAISYVGLEFTWPDGKRAETWGLRVEFASAAEQHGRVTPFYIPSALTRADFLDDKRRPLELAAFRAMVESRGAREEIRGRLYAGLEEYLRDMSQQAHLNFDRAVLRNLLPTAMSFTFLRSFNDFCRSFILPADRLDVSDVTSSYRAFLRYEGDLAELNDQLERLRGIHELFRRHTDLNRDKRLARYLEAELRQQHAIESLREDEEKLGSIRAAGAEEDRRLEELDALIPAQRGALDQLKALINQSSEGQLYSFLRSRNGELARKIEDLQRVGTSLTQALGVRIKSADEWLRQLRALPLELDPELGKGLEKAIRAAELGGFLQTGTTLGALQETAQRAAQEVGRVAQPTLARLSEVRRELGKLREEIGALRSGKLPFPTRLLDALNQSLLSKGPDLPAQPLCKLCEVSDERWRPAVEVAFTRKFAIVVSADDYDAAEKIYHQLREQAPGESLINPTKAAKLARPIKAGSLAEKIQADHPVARAVISNLFGDLICVEKRDGLRKHDYAILPDGFMTRGAFVERPRNYDNLPFVGRRGLDQQLAWKERHQKELEVEEAKLRPLADEIEALQQRLRERFETPAALYQDLARAQELPALQAELEENIAKLNSIDRARFDDLALQQSELERAIEILAREQRSLLQSPKRAQIDALSRRIDPQRQEVQNRTAKFQEIAAADDISPWVTRLEELRTSMFAEYPKADIAANRFADQSHNCAVEETRAWEQLRATRRELAQAHPRYDELPIEALENESYDRPLARLEESEIRDYREKAERERRNWEQLFRTQVIEKLRAVLFEVENIRILLNGYLKQPIGHNRYRIVKWDNPDFKLYHRLLEASAVAGGQDDFFASTDVELREAIAHFLRTLCDQPDGAEAARLLDYRHYYEYDMEVEDITQPNVPPARVDRQSGKFSGGENQSPYFIAILASYLRAYKRHETRRKEPSLALVPIDEAFSKLSGERIRDCIKALKQLDLQGVFSMSTGNIPYAFEHCDSLVVVAKEERRVGKKTDIRNVPVCLAKQSEDAQRLVGEL